MVNEYIPQRGDIAWITFSDTVGHEQTGRRPALVISPFEYNLKSGLCIICPITSKIKGHPFEVLVNDNKVNGVVLANQIRSISYSGREAQKITTANADILQNVVERIEALIS